MRGGAGRLLSLAAVLAALLAPSGAEAREPLLRMTEVQVAGGEEAWHAEPFFRLDWTQEPGPPVEAAAVVYRVYDAFGNPLVGPLRESEAAHTLSRIQVPPSPGVYTVETWLENLEGTPGPHVTAQLRFDDRPPSPPSPRSPSGWKAGSKPVLLEIGHPPQPYPLSGIRGYAVSVDRGGGGSPCAAPTRCNTEETDLDGGVEDDTISLGTLPEGINFVRVAAVSGAGVPSQIESAEVRIDATPPVTSLVDAPSGWSNRPLWVTAVARDELSGMAPSSASRPFTALAVDGRWSTAAGDRVSARVAGSGAHRLSFYGQDAAGNIADGQAGAPAPAEATVRIDEGPPRVAFAARQDPGEPERIEATVADTLSGPSGQRGSIAVRPLGTGARFEELPTEVTAGRLVAHWDSDSYPSGIYEFRATGFDLAGNSATGALRGDGAKMVLPSPLKTPVAIASGFGVKPHSWRAKKRLPYGRGVRYGGRLRTSAGTPVGGAEVTVTETLGAGSAPARRTTIVRTEADGTFSLRLAPGPSREVSAAFGGSRVLTRAVGSAAHLAVRSAVRLHASASVAKVGGAPVVFSGRVGRAGAKVPKGMPVELQFRYPGAGWREFRSVAARADGRFRYTYRFSDDDSRGVRFQFRAVVAAQEDWPYATGASRPVIVTGR